MSDETYNDLMKFVPYEQIEEIENLTGFEEEEILKDYLLFITLSGQNMDYETWYEYFVTTLDFY